MIATGFVVRGYITSAGVALRRSVTQLSAYLHGGGADDVRSEGMNLFSIGAHLTKLAEEWDNTVVVTDLPSHMIGTMNFKE